MSNKSSKVRVHARMRFDRLWALAALFWQHHAKCEYNLSRRRAHRERNLGLELRVHNSFKPVSYTHLTLPTILLV
eukprot:1276865-Pyramimonas_sp.AAC.1